MLVQSARLQVISHLYELHGPEVAGMLDGFFAFVVLDTRNNTFYAARDPIGITCMYIGWGKDGSVWLSSEMKCLKVRLVPAHGCHTDSRRQPEMQLLGTLHAVAGTWHAGFR